GIPLRAPDEAVRLRARQLGNELLVVSAVGGLPVGPPQFPRGPPQDEDVERQHRPCADGSRKLRLRRSNVAKRDLGFVHTAEAELAQARARLESPEDDREACAANDHATCGAADETKRAR